MYTIEERWMNFRLHCIDPEASTVQLHDMRIAFYAGFTSMLEANMELASLEQAVAISLLKRLSIETLCFANDQV